MVRTFRIAQPTDYGLPLIDTLQCNADEIDAKYTDTKFDCIFETDNNKLFPLGIQFIFFWLSLRFSFVEA